jgi:hypothetical protein
MPAVPRVQLALRGCCVEHAWMLRGFAGLSWNDRASASATFGCGAWVQSDLGSLIHARGRADLRLSTGGCNLGATIAWNMRGSCVILPRAFGPEADMQTDG